MRISSGSPSETVHTSSAPTWKIDESSGGEKNLSKWAAAILQRGGFIRKSIDCDASKTHLWHR